jgi:hypothetical protein
VNLTESIAPRSDQIERWVDVPGYVGIYEVSDLGRVRSLNRLISNGHRRQGKILKPIPHGGGYELVNLWRDNRSRMHLIHRLVLTAFEGPAPVGTEALHADGDPANNRLSNLSWGTHAQNQADQVAHGTHVNASKDRCPQGHPYDDANTYHYPGRAHRGCRTCRRQHARNARKAAAA